MKNSKQPLVRQHKAKPLVQQQTYQMESFTPHLSENLLQEIWKHSRETKQEKEENAIKNINLLVFRS